MAKRVLQRSFTGGELSPAMYGRLDDQKYQTGLSICRNFIVLPQGPVVTRPGFEFVREAKYPDKKCRLIPFQFSASQTMVVELGHKYARFHTFGETLISGDEPYEIETPYDEADLLGIKYCQSGDIITLVHSKYAPRELRRYGALDWRLVEINFSAGITAPNSVTASYSCGKSDKEVQDSQLQPRRYTAKYRVTAMKEDDEGEVESAASATASVQCNLYIDDSFNTIQWQTVEGASRYRVYKSYTGVFGLIGETENLEFVDDNIKADEAITPPRYNEPVWGDEDDYPGAVTYFEQRRFFAGTQKRPQMVWATRPGTERDMSYTLPAQPDNRLKFRIAASQASKINHLVPIQQLLALTESSVFRINDEIAADNISVKPQTSEGASDVQPVIVNSTIVYVAARGGHAYELGYQYQRGGFIAGDLTVRAGHLFEKAYPVDQARMAAPDPVLWFAMSDGSLLGFTYMPDQAVGAWHRHDSEKGSFESVACVTEGDEDILYAVVRRRVGGSEKRFIERMRERRFDSLEDVFQVDCGLTYRGEGTQVLSGLDHLEGETVSILCDGAVLPQEVVRDGKIRLDDAGSVIHVGLPITAELKTLPVALQFNDNSMGQGHMKNINKVWLRVYRSSGIFVGPDFDKMVEVKQRQDEPYGSPPNLLSEEIGILVKPSWGDSGTFVMRQADPLPLQLVGITGDYAD